MVSLDDINSSNARVASSLPPGLVAVFVGGTSGVGETSLKQFAKHSRQPRVYFVGRSQEAGDRIAKECKMLNTEGEYIFIKADTSLIRTVDDVCQDIKSREKSINLLFLTTGSMIAGTVSDYNPYIATPEGLHYAAALVVHSRTRFIVNLLPLLQKATAIRRVISVFVGTMEGAIDTADFQGWKVPLMKQRGHAASIVTLSLEALAKKAPNVSFIHNFPGVVKSGIARGTKGPMMFMVRVISSVIGPLFYMNYAEAGDRHVFLATSAKYPAGMSKDVSGVPLMGEVTVARGTDGQVGSGVYSIDRNGESAGPQVEQLLAKYREEGMVEKVWNHIEDEFKRITGVEATDVKS